MINQSPSTQVATKRSKTKSATTRRQKAAALSKGTATVGGLNIFLVAEQAAFHRIGEPYPLIGRGAATRLANRRLLKMAARMRSLEARRRVNESEPAVRSEIKRLVAAGAVIGPGIEEVLTDILAGRMKGAGTSKLPVQVVFAAVAGQVDRIGVKPSKLPVQIVTLPPIEKQRLTAQDLVDRSPIRRIDPVVEKLQKRTVDAVLNGASWVTSKEVGTRADSNAANKHALASRLLKERRVFAIERAGRKEFPDYAFDPLGNPIPAMREVLGILAGYSSFRLASWFESKSSRLGGRRPREVLVTDPQAVIAAARGHMLGPVHG